MIIVQSTHLRMPPRSLDVVLERLKGHLLCRANGKSGVVLLAPEHLIAGNGLNVMAIADTRSRAEGHLEAVIRMLEVDKETLR